VGPAEGISVMTIACVWVPHFALRVALLERPELDGVPLVLTSPSSNRAVVASCTPEARRHGIVPGMPLREVTALCPEVVFLSPNPARDAAAHARIVEALERFSPLVEPAELGCWYVDLRGLGRHHSSLAEAARRLLGLVSPALRPRVGIAPGKFTAAVAARCARPGSFRIVAPADVRAFLAPAPVDWLPVPSELIRRLHRLGLNTLADLAALPAPAVAARFGPAGQHAWNLANGRDETTVFPRPRLETVQEAFNFPAPVTSREALLLGLERLVRRAFARPKLQHRHARQARLLILIENNRSWERVMTFREPVGAKRLIETLRHRLEQLDLPGAAEGLTLELIGLVSETARQERLPGSFVEARSRRLRPLTEAVRQLKQRYGDSPIYRIVEVEPWSRIPERRHALMAYDP